MDRADLWAIISIVFFVLVGFVIGVTSALCFTLRPFLQLPA